MKAYGGSKGRTPHILNLGARCKCMVSFNSWPLYSQEITPIPNELKAGWIPQPVWTFWVREKIHASVGIRTPNRATCNLVTVQTMLSQFCRCPLWPEYFPKHCVPLQLGFLYIHEITRLIVSDGRPVLRYRG